MRRSEVSDDGCTGFAGLAGVTLAGLADKSLNRIAVLENVTPLLIKEVDVAVPSKKRQKDVEAQNENEQQTSEIDQEVKNE